jgi:hypothetical protein
MSLKNCLVNDFAAWHVQKRNFAAWHFPETKKQSSAATPMTKHSNATMMKASMDFSNSPSSVPKDSSGQLETSSDPRPDGDPAVNKSAKSPFFSRSMFSLNTEIH